MSTIVCRLAHLPVGWRPAELVCVRAPLRLCVMLTGEEAGYRAGRRQALQTDMVGGG